MDDGATYWAKKQKQEQALKMTGQDQIEQIMKMTGQQIREMAGQQRSLEEDDKMDYDKVLEEFAKPGAEKTSDRKHIIELLESIDGTLKEILAELKSK